MMSNDQSELISEKDNSKILKANKQKNLKEIMEQYEKLSKE